MVVGRKLGEARESFTEAGLGLLANYKKRLQLLSLLKALSTIKTLVHKLLVTLVHKLLVSPL